MQQIEGLQHLGDAGLSCGCGLRKAFHEGKQEYHGRHLEQLRKRFHHRRVAHVLLERRRNQVPHPELRHRHRPPETGLQLQVCRGHLVHQKA